MDREHKYSSLGDFVISNRKAIDAERLEETIQFEQIIQHYPTKELQQLGLIVNNLKVKTIKSGLYGRTLVTFARPGYSKTVVQTQKDVEKLKIPQCRFGPGDNVGLFEQAQRIQGPPFLSGIIHNKLQFKITVAFEQSQDIREEELESRTFCLCSVTNDVTYNRYGRVLNELEQADRDNDHPSKRIIKSLFEYVKYPPVESVKNNDPNLNEEQRNAVSAALASQSVHLIHGPPGTGKTKTVCALIVQAIKKNYRVLACAGSNVAVDNIVERIQKNKQVKPCRIGHPSRMLKSVQDYCLDSLVFKTSSQKILKQLKHQYDQLKDKYIKANEKQTKKQLKSQMIEKRNEIRVQSEVAVKQVLHDSNVICCTNTGAADKVFSRQLKDTIFDLVVIDQCAQAVQVSCWIPILKGRRLILAGDHLQLPPTIKSRGGNTLEYTLFDRAMKECPVTSTLLTTQYRMNSSIMQWSSKQFYEGRLVADKSVKDHTISDLVGQSQVPLMFIDTVGCKMGQQMDKDQGDLMKSKKNIGEADLVRVVFNELRGHNLKPEQIGIITPYNAQVNFIKELLQGQNVEISTVDGFQGRQKQCIIISMVRSNPKKQVGFLADKRRMNVAVTRAKRLVCLIGDSQTVSNDPTLKTLVDYFTQHGQLRNALDFQKDPTVRFGLGHTQFNQNQPKKQKQQKQKPKKKKKQKDQPLQGGKQLNDQQLDKLKEQASQQLQATANRPLMPSLNRLRQLQQKYLGVIQGFLASKDTVMQFSQLPSQHRRAIHSICQILDIDHETSADKKKLTIAKMVEQQPKQPQEVKQQVQSMQQQNQRKWKEYQNKIRKNMQDLKRSEQNHKNYRNLNADEKTVIRTTATEYKFMTEQNKKVLTVFKDKGRWETEKKIKEEASTAPLKKKEKQVKQENQQQMLKQLDQMIAQPKKCHYIPTKCSVVVQHRLRKCQYCSDFFCQQHIVAQKHGCDKEAQRRAQMDHRRKYEQSKFENPKSNPMLKIKLDQMMKDMQNGRKPKGSK